jgi:hypothetical protein
MSDEITSSTKARKNIYSCEYAAYVPEQREQQKQSCVFVNNDTAYAQAFCSKAIPLYMTTLDL